MPVFPTAQSARIAEIRQLYWDSLDDALDVMDDQIAARARISMARIRKSNFNPSVIRRETRKIVAHTRDRMTIAIAEQIEVAALYAQRAADLVRAWEIAGRLTEGVEHLSVSDSALARARRPGVSTIDAEAALTRAKTAALRTPREVRATLADYGAQQARATYTGPATSGTKIMDKLRRVGLVKKSSEIGLSERLHGSAARNVRETERAATTAIREASNMNKAGRDLVSAVRKGGDELSVTRRLTKPLTRLKRAGRELQLLSINKADPDALKAATKAFRREFAKVKRVAATLVDSRAGYREMIQIIEEQGAKGMDKALGRWLEEKQRSHAERIVETETHAAYRSREAQQVQSKPYVRGFWWRRSVGMLALDAKRKKDLFRTRPKRKGGKRGKRKTKGKPCQICPQLADRFFPKSYAVEYPRGAHPK